MRKRFIAGLCLMVLLAVGCETVDGKREVSPSALAETGRHVREIGKTIPGAPGAGLELLGWGLAIAGGAAAAWKTRTAQRRKEERDVQYEELLMIRDALEATASGIDEAIETMPEESVKRLKEALFKEQAKTGTVEVVAEVRKR